MYRTPLFALVVLTASLGPSLSAQPDAAAAEIKALMNGLNAEKARLPQIKAEADDLVQRNNPLKREYDLYAEQRRTRMAPMADALKARIGHYGAEVARHNEGVAQHNAGCTGTVPKPVYDRCMGQKSYWDGRQAALNAKKADLERDVASYQKQDNAYVVRMNQLAATMEANIAAWKQRKQAYDATAARIRQYEQRLVQACKAAAARTDANANEALHYCHSINWDGKKTGLPELNQ